MPSASGFETAVLDGLSELKDSVKEIQHTLHGNGHEGLKSAVARLLADKAHRDSERKRESDGRKWLRREIAGPVINKVVMLVMAIVTAYAVKEIKGTRAEVQEIKQQQTHQMVLPNE